MLCCTVFYLPTQGYAQNESSFQADFNRGNQLYEDGKYTEALESFQAAEKLGSHWKLFYNMGNCFYKLGRFVDAKIYYLRAERLKPFDISILKNIEIVDKKFSDRVVEEEPDFLARVIKKIETTISMNILSVALLLGVFALNLFFFLLLKKGKSRGLLYGLSFSLVIAILLFSYHVYRVNKQNLRDTAVIVQQEAILRSGPGETNTILFRVKPGLKVKIIDKNRGWLQVSASKEIAGWIKEKAVEKI